MSPVGYLMIHNPATQIMGEVSDLERGIEMLGEVKEGIINSYQKKTGLSRTKIAKMMDAETYLNAKAAVKLGFADGVLYGDVDDAEEVMFNRATPANAVASAFRRKLTAKIKPPAPKLPLPEPPQGTPIQAAMERLQLISGGTIHV
jgi:ATP-dependent Clp protease protease subunit